MTYALFQQVGLKFLEHRDNPDMFEPVPTAEDAAPKAAAAAPAVTGGDVFTVTGGGQTFVVQVAKATGAAAAAAAAASAVSGASAAPAAAAVSGADIVSPLAGNVWKIEVEPGQEVKEGDLLLILEAMKMENEIFADRDGIVGTIHIEEGNAVDIGQPLVTLLTDAVCPASTACSPAAAASAPPKGGVTAPLAGNVWKIEVHRGQQVQEGDLLLILEAMKMENEIFADKDGTVGQILIQEGTAVDIGQVLLTLD